MDRRIAVVTGANRGIGYEIARQLAASGIKIVLATRDREKGESAVRQLRADGADVDFYRLDVTKEEDVAALARHVEESFGAADILINNAGVLLDPRGSRLLDAEEQVFRATMEVNFYGPLRLIHALA